MHIIELQNKFNKINEQFQVLTHILREQKTLKIIFDIKLDPFVLVKFGVVCCAKGLSRYAIKMNRDIYDMETMFNTTKRLIESEFERQYKIEMRKQIKRNSKQLIKNSRLMNKGVKI